MTSVTSRSLSRGHGEAFDGTVWANERARQAWAGGGPLPEGSVLLEEAMSDAGTALGALRMEKQTGGWRFDVLDPAGRFAQGVPVAACAGCHAQAPRDQVFQEEPKKTMANAKASTATVANAVTTTAATNESRSAGSAAVPSSR